MRLADGACAALLVLALGATCAAQPPLYTSIPREQQIAPSIDESDLMRIWVVYVGQGDGILIQLPERLAYDPDPDDGDDARTERIDILIDGGSHADSDAPRMAEFLGRLYPDGATIEHVVITHHDEDHVSGFTHLLTETDFRFGHVYHNGLVSYASSAFPGSGVLRKDTRAMGRVVDGSPPTINPDDALPDLDRLAQLVEQERLQGKSAVYRRLADALLAAEAEERVLGFDRCFVSESSQPPFIQERSTEMGLDLGGVGIELLWPRESLVVYGGNDWGETINGNSLVFRVTMGEFEMLFTGDMNEHSEEAFIEHIRADDPDLSALDCDVLKVPHHGSSHALERFMRRDSKHRRPAVSVASLGYAGFSLNWKHPSTSVITWLGGAHRVYCTHIHERRFDWDDMGSLAAREAMLEQTHVLVETDGTWFRVVELPVETGDPHAPPPVGETRRSNGTRWISATIPGG